MINCFKQSSYIIQNNASSSKYTKLYKMRQFCTFTLTVFVLSLLNVTIGSNDATQQTSLVVNLYYETLCPDCQAFSRQQLCPVWEKLDKYFKIEFVPYGNAETNKSETGKISITCQHGPPECAGNRLHACAIHSLQYVQSTRFICCMESAKDFEISGPICAKKFGIHYKALKMCAEGSEGNYLHYLNGVRTSKLTPQHEFVPWILFNDKYDKDDMERAQDDLISVLCKYLDPKPRECNEVE